MTNLNWLMDHILYQIFKTFEYVVKEYETVTGNFPIKIYVNKIEKRITFKIKAGGRMLFFNT